MKSLDVETIRAKYPEQIAEKIIQSKKTIDPLIANNNQSFAIRIEHLHYITKDKNRATETVYIDKDADTGVQIVKELKDPNDTHKFNAKSCIKEINKRLSKLNINIEFNMYHFNLFCKYYDIKNNKKLCYIYRIQKKPTYSYSMQTIDFIVDEIKKDPENIIQNLKKAKK